MTGYVWMRRYARFRVDGNLLIRLGRYAVGLVGLAIALFGLDALFGALAPDETALGLILRSVRYGTVTLWAIFGAPWLFLKLKLAQPELEVKS